MDSSWNIGSIGMAGPPLRGPSAQRLLAEPPLSPPVSPGAAPRASAQPLEPVHAPLLPPATSMPVGSATAGTAGTEPAPRQTVSLEALLMRFRLITSEQLDEALREKAETGKDVGAVVVERGWVNEDQLARLLSYAPAFPASNDPAPEEAAGDPPAAAEVATVEEQPEPVEASHVAEPEPFAEQVLEPVVEQVEEPATEPFAPPAHEPAPMWSAPAAPSLPELPPALELIEPEPVAVAAEPVAPEPEPAAAELTPVAPEPEPVAALDPVVPELDPFAEPEPFELLPEPVALEPVAVEPGPVAVEPEPVAVEAEPVAVPPEPVAVSPEPAIAPEPVAEPAPVVAAEAQVVRFVEPAPIETIARVFVRLANGERVEAGSFDDMAAAKARAEEVVAQVSTAESGWPFFAGRYIRPESVVSVDLDATVVRYA